MFQIRHTMFETNSSSCHVFGFRPDVSVAVPSVIELIPDSDESMLQVLFNDNYKWYSPGVFGEDYMTNFIDMLYACGVKKINCSDKNIVSLAEERKEIGNRPSMLNLGWISINDFKTICFSDDTKLTTMEDWMVSDEAIAKEFGDGYNYCSLRLS